MAEAWACRGLRCVQCGFVTLLGAGMYPRNFSHCPECDSKQFNDLGYIGLESVSAEKLTRGQIVSMPMPAIKVWDSDRKPK